MVNLTLGSALAFGWTLLSVSPYLSASPLLTSSEPASLLIFGFSLLALAVLARRSRRHPASAPREARRNPSVVLRPFTLRPQGLPGSRKTLVRYFAD